MSRRRKKNRPKAKVITPEQQQRRRRLLLLLVNGLAVVVVVGIFLIGYSALAAHVRDHRAIAPARPLIVLADRPAWMTDSVADALAARLYEAMPARPSRLRHDTVVAVHAQLQQDPWVNSTRQVRWIRDDEGRDLIEIACDWRLPMAIARWDDGRGGVYQLVSDEGVLLPMPFTASEVARIIAGRDRRTNLRVITGVRRPPPAVPGGRWDDPLLAAGLEVAELLHGHPAAREVTVIDVRNAEGELDSSAPRVVLQTRFGTDVYWGRPPGGSDFLIEARPEVKLRHLQTATEKFAKAGAWPAWVDLRGDVATYARP